MARLGLSGPTRIEWPDSIPMKDTTLISSNSFSNRYLFTQSERFKWEAGVLLIMGQISWIMVIFISSTGDRARRRRVSSWLKAKAVSRPIWSGRRGFNSCHPQHKASLHASCFPPSSMPASIVISINLIVCQGGGRRGGAAWDAVPDPTAECTQTLLASMVVAW